MKHDTLKNATLDLGKIKPYIGDDGTFDVPDDLNIDVLDRLKSAGYKIIVPAVSKNDPEPSMVPKEEEVKTEDPGPKVADTENPPSPVEPETKYDGPQLELLTSVKGIGEKTAKKLVDTYGYNAKIVEVGVDTLAADIDGLTVEHAKELIEKLKATL